MKTFILLLALMLLASPAAADFTDLRPYIDSSARLANADTLTSADSYSDSVWVVGATTIACDVYIVDITTNVIIGLYCSNNGTDWMNCDASGNTTITADGQYSLVFTNAHVFRYYKLYWVSESGSTAKMLPAWKVGGKI